jgi:hypothetical protein
MAKTLQMAAGVTSRCKRDLNGSEDTVANRLRLETELVTNDDIAENGVPKASAKRRREDTLVLVYMPSLVYRSQRQQLQDDLISRRLPASDCLACGTPKVLTCSHRRSRTLSGLPI